MVPEGRRDPCCLSFGRGSSGSRAGPWRGQARVKGGQEGKAKAACPVGPLSWDLWRWGQSPLTLGLPWIPPGLNVKTPVVPLAPSVAVYPKGWLST